MKAEDFGVVTIEMRRGNTVRMSVGLARFTRTQAVVGAALGLEHGAFSGFLEYHPYRFNRQTGRCIGSGPCVGGTQYELRIVDTENGQVAV